MDGDMLFSKNRHKPYLGRQKIYTSETSITKSNILDVLSKAFLVHEKNAKEVKYLRDYYKGKQDIYNRHKDFREEICNIIVENRAYELIEFAKGYIFGEPIQYVQNGDCSYTDEDEMNPSPIKAVQALNEMMRSAGKASVDSRLGEDMLTVGTAYRYAMPQEADKDLREPPFRITNLNPERTFVVYSNDPWESPVLGVTYVYLDENHTIRRFTAYTPNRVFVVTEQSGIGDLGAVTENAKVEEYPNGISRIPIIEYPLNKSRLGYFEPALTLLDAINNTESNRMDGIEQFIQSFVKFINCDMTAEGFEDLKRKGGLVLKGVDGQQPDAEIMESSLDQSQSQIYADHLYQSVLTICGAPDREASSGGNTGQALIISQGWANAESRAKFIEEMYKDADREFLKVIKAIIDRTDPAKMPEEIVGLSVEDVSITFTRNKTDSLLVKTQGLLNLLEAGLHPKIAISLVGLVSDPEQVYHDSEEYLDKWKETEAESSEYKNFSDPEDIVPKIGEENSGSD